MSIESKTPESLQKEPLILQEKVALGRSNDRQTGKGTPNTEEGVWLLCHTTEAAPDVSRHTPSALSSVAGEAVTASRNCFTKRQQPLQPIYASAQEKLPQLSCLNLAMPKRDKKRGSKSL